jgi:2'-5' RNA ligase
MSDELRLFVALELPSAVLDGLAAVQDRLRREHASRAVRWVQMSGIHLTLKFLGETPAANRAPIAAAVHQAAAGYTPLSLTAVGLGCFPNARQPRVVWVGLEGDLAALAALQRSVERALAPLGFPPEKRGFSPHLTLGRVRREASAADAKALGRLIEETSIGLVGAWTADAVSLMRSELGRDGARYTCLDRVTLAGSE